MMKPDTGVNFMHKIIEVVYQTKTNNFENDPS